MRLIQQVCLIGFVFVAEIMAFGEGRGRGGWEPLFNGKDLSGWRQMNEGAYLATNGVIRLAGGRGWLRTEKEYGDFVLEAEARGLETNYNSGIFLHAPAEGKPWPTNAWQLNLKQSAIGELLQGSTRIVASKSSVRSAGGWIKLRIEVSGSSISLQVDGQHVWDFKDFTPARGFIGLQAEGKSFEFRNLRIGTLPTVDAPVILPAERP